MASFLHESWTFAETDFEVICFCVKPDFCFIGHRSSQLCNCFKLETRYLVSYYCRVLSYCGFEEFEGDGGGGVDAGAGTEGDGEFFGDVAVLDVLEDGAVDLG